MLNNLQKEAPASGFPFTPLFYEHHNNWLKHKPSCCPMIKLGGVFTYFLVCLRISLLLEGV